MQRSLEHLREIFTIDAFNAIQSKSNAMTGLNNNLLLNLVNDIVDENWPLVDEYVDGEKVRRIDGQLVTDSGRVIEEHELDDDEPEIVILDEEAEKEEDILGVDPQYKAMGAKAKEILSLLEKTLPLTAVEALERANNGEEFLSCFTIAPDSPINELMPEGGWTASTFFYAYAKGLSTPETREAYATSIFSSDIEASMDYIADKGFINYYSDHAGEPYVVNGTHVASFYTKPFYEQEARARYEKNVDIVDELAEQDISEAQKAASEELDKIRSDVSMDTERQMSGFEQILAQEDPFALEENLDDINAPLNAFVAKHREFETKMLSDIHQRTAEYVAEQKKQISESGMSKEDAKIANARLKATQKSIRKYEKTMRDIGRAERNFVRQKNRFANGKISEKAFAAAKAKYDKATQKADARAAGLLGDDKTMQGIVQRDASCAGKTSYIEAVINDQNRRRELLRQHRDTVETREVNAASEQIRKKLNIDIVTIEKRRNEAKERSMEARRKDETEKNQQRKDEMIEITKAAVARKEKEKELQ